MPRIAVESSKWLPTMRTASAFGLSFGLSLGAAAQVPGAAAPALSAASQAAPASQAGQIAAEQLPLQVPRGVQQLDPALELATGPAGTVTLDEVLTSLRETVPVAQQASLLQSPERLGQLASSVYRNKWLAERARAANLAVKEPEGPPPSEMTRTRFWAEQYMRHMVGQAMPDDATLEKLARTAMIANPANYRLPADKRVRHILLDARQGPDPKVEARAQALVKQLNEGADFATLAKSHSQDTHSAVAGGELGWLHGLDYPEAFLTAVSGLNQVGQRSAVFRTAFGYHIVELEEQREERAMTETEATAVMREQVLARRNQEVRSRLWQQAGESVKLNNDNLQRVVAASHS